MPCQNCDIQVWTTGNPSCNIPWKKYKGIIKGLSLHYFMINFLPNKKRVHFNGDKVKQSFFYLSEKNTNSSAMKWEHVFKTNIRQKQGGISSWNWRVNCHCFVTLPLHRDVHLPGWTKTKNDLSLTRIGRKKHFLFSIQAFLLLNPFLLGFQCVFYYVTKNLWIY